MGTSSVAAMACLKTLLMIFNIIFSLSGAALLLIGIAMYWKLSTFLELSTVQFNTLFYMLVATGTITLLSGLCACFCTAKGHPKLLYTFGFILFVFVFLELGEGIFLAVSRHKLADGFKEGLNQTMIKFPNSSSSHDSLVLLQENLKCCGSDNYTDWKKIHQVIPNSCCKTKACNVDNVSEIYTEGCYEVIVKFMETNFKILTGVAIGFALFPFIGVILSCCLADIIKRENYEPMY